LARIIVMGNSPRPLNDEVPVLMDEEVKPDHLADEHIAHQIIERVAWAVLDAEEAIHRVPAPDVGARLSRRPAQTRGLRHRGVG